MADNSRAINRIFTHKVICDLIQNGKNDVFRELLSRVSFEKFPQSSKNVDWGEILSHASRRLL